MHYCKHDLIIFSIDFVRRKIQIISSISNKLRITIIISLYNTYSYQIHTIIIISVFYGEDRKDEIF